MSWFRKNSATDEFKARIRESDELIKQAQNVISFLDAKLKHVMTFNDNLPSQADEEQQRQLRHLVHDFNQRLAKVSSSLHAAVRIKQEAQSPVWEGKVFRELAMCTLKEGRRLDISIEETHVALQTILKNLKDPLTKGMLIASVKGAQQKDPVQHHIHETTKSSK